MKKKSLFMVIILAIITVAGMNMKETAQAAVAYTEVTVVGMDASGKTDSSAVLQEYLNQARDNATDAKQYKIIIPAGSYRLEKSLKIYSNTYLYMKGVTLNRCGANIGMFRTGNATDKFSGYKGYRNITLDGGTINANCNVSEYAKNNASIFRAAHAQNITIKNVTMKNGMNLHYVEVTGVDGLTVSNCKISGLESTNTKNTKNNEIEAIQLDILHTADRMDNFYNYDDTPMKNVTITGCTFSNLQKGVGGHSMVIGSYFENVKVTNNKFTNLTKAAIAFENYRNCEISGNTITNCGMGIDIKSMHSVEGLGVGESKVYMPNGVKTPVINANAKMVIKNNVINVIPTKYVPTPFAIKLFGEIVDTSTAKYAKILDGNYYIKNVTIQGNKITTKGIGIKLQDAKSCKIIGNTINYNGGAADTTKYNICAYDGSTYLTISNNVITNAPKHGIYLLNGCNNATITGNKISNVQMMGINLYNCKSGNKIEKNTIKNVGKDGIMCEKSSGSIKNNYVSTTSRNGITVVHGTVATISSNRIYNVAYRGIMVDEQARATVYNNNVKKCGLYGVDVVSYNLTTSIKANTISNCGKCSIHVSGSNSLSIKSFSAPKITRRTVKKKSITIKYTSKDKATKYIIYRQTGNGSFKKIATTSKTTYVDKKVKKNKTYSYKVVAYSKKGKVTVYSAYSKASKKVKAK